MKNYDDDDGRTVADMSYIDPHPIRHMLVGRRPSSLKPKEETEEHGKHNEPVNEMDRDERRGLVFGAVSAALLIGGIFIGAAAIFIAILYFAF